MRLEPLTAISPVDGRYRATTQALADYFSERALMTMRLKVECEYLTALSETEGDRKSTRLNSSHSQQSRMPSSA